MGTNWDVGGFTSNSGTVTFTAAGTIYTATAFNNLIKSGAATITAYNTGIALSAVNVTVSSGTLTLANVAGTQTVTGNVSGAGTLNASASAGGQTS